MASLNKLIIISWLFGHTFLPNDRDFSVIEKTKPVEKAYIPDDWVRIVSSSKTNKPFLALQAK